MINQEIPVLAKKIYQLSALKPAELEKRKWEALAILNAVYSSATPAGVAAAQAEKMARWGKQIEAAGLLSRLDPQWHLRTDDGKPPAVKPALESAADNPSRDIRTRLQALLFVPEQDRPALADVVRALEDEAWRGAKGDARDQFLTTMREVSKEWFKDPWTTILPFKGTPPVSILIENQGETHDGGWYDDPSDDTALEKLYFGWKDAIRTWDVTFLRDNPVSQFALGAYSIAGEAADAAGSVAKGSKEGVEALGKILKWAPWVAAGVGTIGLTTWVVRVATRPPK